MIGGSPSYVELSTCLDMDKSVTELKKADRTLDSGMDRSSNKATDPYTVLANNEIRKRSVPHR